MEVEMQTKVVGKISELLTTNISELIPSVGILERTFENMKGRFEIAQTEKVKMENLAKDASVQINALKKEFEYVKNRFNP